MLEQRLDIFSPAALELADAICFTSNGVVKNSGELVMGAGIAKVFRDRFTGLAMLAGEAVRRNGNICQIVDMYPVQKIPYVRYLPIIAFPTKHNWRDPSDLILISKSSHKLMELVKSFDLKHVLLPRPGCSNGGLDWERQVRPEISPILDDRIIIVSR